METSSISSGEQRRQDRGKARGEHRLAGARRPDHQEIVPAGGRHLEHALGALLPLDVGEVGERARLAREVRLGPTQRLQPLK